jgi:hypothetical protein
MNRAIHGERAVGRRAAWAVFVTTCAIWAAALLLDWMTRGVSSHDGLGPYDIVGLVVVTLLLAFPATGLVIALRRPATPIGSGRLREQVDIETVSGEVLHVVRETLQPAHAALWIRPHEADA